VEAPQVEAACGEIICGAGERPSCTGADGFWAGLIICGAGARPCCTGAEMGGAAANAWAEGTP
jgi:hypothetical protein